MKRRSAEGRSVPISGIRHIDDDTITLLAAFSAWRSRGELRAWLGRDPLAARRLSRVALLATAAACLGFALHQSARQPPLLDGDGAGADMVMAIDVSRSMDTRDTPPSSDEFVEAQARYYHRAIECFGADRCMFESNFPVDRRSLSYQVLYNGLKKIAADRTEEEKTALFSGTASRIYRLD